MNLPPLTIIGAGHMATYLLNGLAHAGVDLSQVCITDTDEAKLAHLAQRFSVQTSTDNNTAIARAEIVLLAIKPQSLSTFAQQHRDAFSHLPIVISILAGMPIAQISALLGPLPIVRAMPNILVALSQGNTILFAPKHYHVVEQIFAQLGVVKWVGAENQLDAYTVLTGCGPGYLFFIMQSVIDAAVALGIPENDAKTEVLQLFAGSARMALESHHSLVELQQQVASKKGVTERILTSLTEQHTQAIFKQAFLDGFTRNQELKNHKE
ncbi:MAG: pyrroline-5-carboxylate reductase [Gammaproteobacteria bacterium]